MLKLNVLDSSRIGQVVTSLRINVSYCHECGEPISDSWEICPECSGRILSNNPKKEFFTAIWFISSIVFLIYMGWLISLSAIDPSLLLGLMFGAFFSMPIILIIAMSTSYQEHSSLTDKITGKNENDDDWHWIRTRFLLMNILAIIAASLGISSTRMNYIIFWGVLLLGTLIWVIPSNKNQNR